MKGMPVLTKVCTVLEYQKNIHKQLRTFRGFAKVTYETVIPNHVGMWVMKRGTM